ncbi:hypothetical protein FNF27_07641 [Cafeteria roenbergensis]|uniref:Uncharacterized protein n=1 Tax=Cafeteria roenbergensis TaxID=33653 RepID=A0A5A8CKJ6_CAFRO|nr:hypothetical protein FNF31_07632 [Cafeteria roenbergensis]KAA0153545.1 hypothetical protein FNF29_02934 [Cafeteria roenbergensis]KAA0165438.1 hypothetical protein FNF27_07641 [Cafeteria roenbergensis]|eukprot:KAA0153545.1 hypothetical protein FNF29_02934 [Cafeteria roenbergensis]
MSASARKGTDAKPDWAVTAEKWAPAGFALLGVVCMAGGAYAGFRSRIREGIKEAAEEAALAAQGASRAASAAASHHLPIGSAGARVTHAPAAVMRMAPHAVLGQAAGSGSRSESARGAAPAAHEDDDDDFGGSPGLGVPGSEFDLDAARIGATVIPGTGQTAGDVAGRALLYGTLLALTGTGAVALAVAWSLDAWTLMDVSDRLFVVLPRVRDAVDGSLGQGLRSVSEVVRDAAPEGPGSAAARAADPGAPLMPDLPRADARVLAETDAEWDELEVTFDRDQALRRQQIVSKGLVPPEGVTLPGRHDEADRG